MFMAWLQALEDSGRRIWNPPAVARQRRQDLSCRRSSLPALRFRGRDGWIASTAMRSTRDARRRLAARVLKPRIAATAYGTFLIDRGQLLADDDLAPARASGALLQEVIPEIIERGEMSLGVFRRRIQPRRRQAGEGRRLPRAKGFRRARRGDHTLAHCASRLPGR